MSSYRSYATSRLAGSRPVGIAVTPFATGSCASAETAVRLTERPAVTHSPAPKSETRANQEIYYLVITRDDHSAKKGPFTRCAPISTSPWSTCGRYSWR
jgi:hypothetical protein